ncbi:hypothetical protein SALBM311S_07783 [Streptomyces alboniger]
MAVGGVPRQEDGPDPHTAGDDALELPVADGMYLDVEVGDAEHAADAAKDSSTVGTVGVAGAEAGVHGPLGRVAPPTVGAHRAQGAGEGALSVGIDEVAEQHVVVGDPLRQVHGGVHSDHVEQPGGAVHLDAQQVGAGAAAVRGDDVPGADLVGPAAVTVHDGRHNPFARTPAGGGEGRQLVVEADVLRPAHFLRPGPQQRVEAQLRDIGVTTRAGPGVPLGVRAAAPRRERTEQLPVRCLRAGERGVPGHLVPAVLRRGEGVHGVGHAHLREDLHGALVEQVRPRQRRGGPVPLDEEDVDSPGPEQSGRTQSGWAAADDQDGRRAMWMAAHRMAPLPKRAALRAP